MKQFLLNLKSYLLVVLISLVAISSQGGIGGIIGGTNALAPVVSDKFVTLQVCHGNQTNCRQLQVKIEAKQLNKVFESCVDNSKGEGPVSGSCISQDYALPEILKSVNGYLKNELLTEPELKK